MADEEPGNLFSAIWKFLAKPITTWIGRQLPDAPKERVRRWWRNHVTKPKLASQDRLSVVISKIYGDDDKETKRNRLIEATKKTGLAGVDPYRLDYCIWQPGSFSEADSLTQAREKARQELSRLKADLLIFGMVDENHFTLHFVPNAKEHSDNAQNIAFNLESGVELPADAGDLLKTIIETTFAAAVDQHLNSGGYTVEKLTPAIAKLEKILASPPAVWSNQQLASLKIHYANCANEIGRQQGDTNWFKKAIAAYEDALEEYTRERASLDWAMTKNNLGNALAILGERGDDRALKKAVTAYENALEERTRERTPLDWAMTKNNLGNALRILGEQHGDDEALKNAIAAYEDALEERTRERTPLDWATTKNNLGNALQTLGNQHGDDEALKKAVAAYEETLEELIRERTPLNWATTKNNLGAALQNLGERGDDDALKKAVTAYECALEERTRKRTPLQWAMTKNNLGNALQILGNQHGDDEALKNAVAAYEDALEERTRKRTPLDWATTKNNLGAALWILGEQHGDDEALKNAVAAYEDALEERTRERTPLDWAMTIENLALAHETQGDRSDIASVKCDSYEKAIALITDTLEVFATSRSDYNSENAKMGLNRIRRKLEALEKS